MSPGWAIVAAALMICAAIVAHAFIAAPYVPEADEPPAPPAPAVDPVDEAFRTAAALLAPDALDTEPTPFADRIEADLRAVTIRPATPPKES